MRRSSALPLWCSVCLACTSLTEPASESTRTAPAQPEAPVHVERLPDPQPEPEAPQVPRPRPAERIEASHVLVAWKGTPTPTEGVTRTKEEARKLAAELRDRAKKGESFAALARQHSDDAGTKARGGSLGAFERPAMVQPFSQAAFSLKPGEISDVVETQFGFHVIHRTR